MWDSAKAAEWNEYPVMIIARTATQLMLFALRKRPATVTKYRDDLWGNTIDSCHAVSRVCDISGSCWRFSASPVPWRGRQTVAGKGNEGTVARTALAAPPKEDAQTFANRSARFQGRSRTRSLEAGHHGPFPDFQDLSDLSVVGRSWSEIASRRPSDSRGILYHHAKIDESEFKLLSCDQHWLSQQIRQGKRPRWHFSYDSRRLLVERLLCDDRRAEQRDLFAGPRLVPRWTSVISGSGLSV